MSLAQQVSSLASAIGAAVKADRARIAALESAGGSAALANVAANLAADTVLTANTLFTVASVNVTPGTWLVSARAHVAYNGAGATADGTLNAGTATVSSFTGGRSSSARTTAANQPVDLVVPGCLVVVTVAGTLLFQVLSATTPIVKAASNGQAYPAASGMSAIKVA